jgi:SAM-dependent methyltransferase
MSFEVGADVYGRFMGRFSEPLAPGFADLAGVARGQRVLDVGAGPGALSAELARRVGETDVAAVDPSASFVTALQARLPGADVRSGTAEDLPHPDDSFDATLAQLVVHFMTDPVAGLRDMGRVTRPGGVVAACVWDHAGGGSPLSLVWSAAQDVDPSAPNEADLPGTREGQLPSYARDAGLREITPSALTVSQRFDSFEEWWAPYLFGVGPLGAYIGTLADDHLAALKERCRELLPEAPFEQPAVAWSVRAVAP